MHTLKTNVVKKNEDNARRRLSGDLYFCVTNESQRERERETKSTRAAFNACVYTPSIHNEYDGGETVGCVPFRLWSVLLQRTWYVSWVTHRI